MNRKKQTRKRVTPPKTETAAKASSVESETKTSKEQPPSEGAVPASIEVEESKAEVAEEIASSLEAVPKKSPKKSEKAKEGAASSTGAVPKKSKQPKKANKAKPSNSSEKTDAANKLQTPPHRSILQLKVTIIGITPPIWRRIQVLNDDTFADLRHNVNEAMGWCGNCCHEFIMYDPKKNSNILIVDGSLDGLTYNFSKSRGKLFKEQTTKLCEFLTAPGDVVMYEYDLGDSWMHLITVEKILPPPSPKEEYPKCIGGKRACPPEDCGGVDGYRYLLELYKNPQLEEYEELIDGWLLEMCPGFDPEKFDHKNVFRKVWMWVGPNGP